MEYYDKSKAKIKAIQQQIIKAKKNEYVNAFKDIKVLCNEFGSTAGINICGLPEGAMT